MMYVSDCASAGVQHEQFNSSFLGLLRKSQSEIIFFGDPEHNAILKSKTSGIHFRNISIYKQRGGFKEFIRAYRQFKNTSGLIRQAESNGVDYFVMLLLHPFAHFLLKMFCRTRVNLYLVTHGELESLKDNKSMFNKIWGWLLKRALKNQKLRIHYIILGESIFENLLKMLPAFSMQKSTVMDHPYPFHKRKRMYGSNDHISFATMGVATTAKNSHYIFHIAERMHASQRLSEYRFTICGRLYKNVQPFMNDHVTCRRDFKPLSRHEVEEWLLTTDFAIFYYDNEHYSLCSSGSFWDAIDAEIPLLYVRNDYIDHYASLAGGIGMAFDSPEQLNDYIAGSNKSSLFDARYAQYILNIRKLKYEIMSDDNLAEQLAGIYN